jgi:site-specific recombinase XerD
VQSAIDAGAIAADVWPQRSKTRARRKVPRTKRSVDVRALPGPAAMAAAIDAIVTQQPGSKTYRVMTAVAYYAGLRPSEVVMLRVRSTELPTEGWGRLDVTEADISFDEPGEPKTGPRSVPIPPVLVAMLREWINDNGLTSPERLLFRTRNNTMPSGSNWARAWHRALESVGQRPIRIYDCRHAAATTWLRAGMPLAETARRLGHSVETLVSTYVGALDDEEHIANQRVDTILGSSAPPLTRTPTHRQNATKCNYVDVHFLHVQPFRNQTAHATTPALGAVVRVIAVVTTGGSGSATNSSETSSAIQSPEATGPWRRSSSGHVSSAPPSTGSTTPVTYDDAGLARKSSACPYSSGCPHRPMTMRCLIRSSMYSGEYSAVISVSNQPGAIAFTRMPLLRLHCWARSRVRPLIAALLEM